MAAEDHPVRPRPTRHELAVERLKRVQEMVRRLPVKPMSVDEFIAEKRREAAREE